MKMCSHLSSPDTNTCVGMIKSGNAWTMSCDSCVAHFIGSSLKRRKSDEEIARSLKFEHCKHKKQKIAGCRTCLASVKRIARYVLYDHDPEQVLALLTKSVYQPRSVPAIHGQHDTARKLPRTAVRR